MWVSTVYQNQLSTRERRTNPIYALIHGNHISIFGHTLISNLPPDTRTPSELSAKQFNIALCPVKFCMKLPSGNFHCLILSAEADPIVYLRNNITHG